MPPGPGLEKLLLGFGIAAALVTATATSLIVPRFAEVFRSFGGNLPYPTWLFVHYYPAAFVLLPSLVLAIWFLWPRRDQRAYAACVAGGSIVALWVPLMVW